MSALSNHQRFDVYSTVCSGAYQRKYQSSAWLAFFKGIHRWPVNPPPKGPVTRQMHPYDDVMMLPQFLPNPLVFHRSSNVDVSSTHFDFEMTYGVIQLAQLDDVIKWKHFPCYWPFVRGIHRSAVNSPHKGQWRGTLMFSLICAWISSWVNNREAGDLLIMTSLWCYDIHLKNAQGIYPRHEIGSHSLNLTTPSPWPVS